MSFVPSCFKFRSLIHFDFMFVYSVRECSNFILLHVAIQFSQHHLLRRLSFLHCYSLASIHSTYNAAGLVAYNYGILDKCYAIGDLFTGGGHTRYNRFGHGYLTVAWLIDNGFTPYSFCYSNTKEKIYNSLRLLWDNW